VKAFDASERGRVEDFFGLLTVDEETLAKGRQTGSLVVDTRLRDALHRGGRPTALPRAEETRAAAESCGSRGGKPRPHVPAPRRAGARLTAVEQRSRAR